MPPVEIIEIVEIGARTAEQDGVSRPFRCEGADGITYYVKLKNAGYQQLISEWVAGRLAAEMGLRPAEIRQVRIPRALVEGVLERELGHGIAFGSRKVDSMIQLSMDIVNRNPAPELTKILLFDYWVRNEDRVLSDLGGNPNLLWSLDEARVVMIDQDKAFDATFDVANFWAGHALRNHRDAWLRENRPEMQAWLESGLAKFDGIWAELPDEWQEDANLERLPGVLDKAEVRAILNRPFDDPERFWI